jgi:hypothetical protein
MNFASKSHLTRVFSHFGCHGYDVRGNSAVILLTRAAGLQCNISKMNPAAKGKK